VIRVLDDAVTELAPIAGRKRACQLLGRSRASYYRTLRPRPVTERVRRPCGRALSGDERQQVIDVLNSEAFCDLAVGAHRKSRFLLIESRARRTVPGARLAMPVGSVGWAVDELGEGLGEGLVFA
jgi:hypothetical protein